MRIKRYGGPDWSCAEEFIRGGTSISTLGRLLSSSYLPIEVKLQIADAAVERGLASTFVLEKIKDPAPGDFGLISRIAPVPEPFATIQGWVERFPGWYLLIIALSIAAYTLFYAGNTAFGDVIGAVLLGGMCSLFFGGALCGLFLLIRNMTPPMRKYRKFCDAVELYHSKRIFIDFLDQMRTAKIWLNADGHRFEQLVSRYFRQTGWTSTVVGGANDKGVDIRLSRGNERAVVQCKAHAKPIPPAVVRELYGAMIHEQCSHAYLATLYGLSKAAREWVEGKPITVLTIDDFLKN